MSTPLLTPQTANTILYCAEWAAAVAFYRDTLGFPVTFANDWFVEFALTDTARLSIADVRRATVPSGPAAVPGTSARASLTGKAAKPCSAACSRCTNAASKAMRSPKGAKVSWAQDGGSHSRASSLP